MGRKADAIHCMGKLWEHNACIAVLVRQASDVGENPGPAIFDVIDPKRTICADYNSRK